MQQPSIRPCRFDDIETMRHICEATSSIPSMKREVLLTLYCDYYIEQEPQRCFVLTDNDDNAVGYVIAAADWTCYCQQYKMLYFPRLRKLSRAMLLHKRLELWLGGKHAVQYPAHLHIDILPDYQGKGHGKRLLDALMEKLAVEGVPGVMLGVGKSNTGAIRFYESYGFKRLGAEPGSYLYGYVIPPV